MQNSEVSVKKMAEPILCRRCEILRTSVRHLFSFPEITRLLQAYADESSNPELPPASPQYEAYIRLEEAGFLHVVAAFVGDKLVGFATIIVADLPHYSVPVASMESIFVDADHRKTGAGIKLVREAEAVAAGQGAKGLLITAPAGGRLSRVMPMIGYRKTNEVFFRAV